MAYGCGFGACLIGDGGGGRDLEESEDEEELREWVVMVLIGYTFGLR
jgi:hypothetical protein